MEKKKTLVLGASENATRYSNLAIKKLGAFKYPVVAIGKRKGEVANIQIETEKIPFSHIDTVTIYLNRVNQKGYYDYIISLHPKRIIFNPGAENEELSDLALENNIKPVEACTLVLLSTGQY